LNFASDNWAGATAEVMAALVRANHGFAPAYGDDALTAKVKGLFAEVFEHEVEVWFTATGTATNSLSLAGLTRPGGMIFCSAEAHIHTDEWGATEFQTQGMKLVPVGHQSGKITPEALGETLARFPEGNRYGHGVGFSLTNATELGTVYAPDEVKQLAGMAREAGLAVHVDGARFGNAVAATGATPAELTWKSGVDFMSFGATKNGCWAAEAIIVFAPGKLRDIEARRQRAGQKLSKARFIAAQFEAYLTDNNWVRWAGHANAMAERLRVGLRNSNRARLGWDSHANEVFAIVPREVLGAARAAGGAMHEWPTEVLPADARPGETEVLVRMVTSWATSEAEIEQFLALL
jgi:threonine aldolase